MTLFFHRVSTLEIYNVSYMWFSAIGAVGVIIIGFLVSLITGESAHNDAFLKVHCILNMFHFRPK